MDRFDRIFDLNRILQNARYPVSRQHLEQELECSRATVKRLIEDMRLYLNAPIKYDRKLNGYIYEHQEDGMYELPGLWFNASELHALLSVQQLLANVTPGLLDSHLQPLKKRIASILGQEHAGSDEISKRIRILQAAARPSGTHFQTIAGAVANCQQLQLSYYGRHNNNTSERQVSPQRLIHYRDNWYLDAWCHLREGLRTFALDAIQQAHIIEQKSKEIPDNQLDDHYASAYGIFSGSANKIAQLKFTPARARWVATEQWHPEQKGHTLDDGSYELHVPYNNPAELIMDILKYGPDVQVIAPQELRNTIAQRITETQKHYQ